MKTKRGVKMPARATEGSAGYDLFAPRNITLKAGEWTEFGTGVSLDGTEAPVMTMRRHNPFTGFDETLEFRAEEWYMLVVPRSGLGFKYAVRIANTVGVIDRDYRDEIRCRLTADEDVTIEKGKAYAQAIFLPYLTLEGEQKPDKARTGGFGSTDSASRENA